MKKVLGFLVIALSICSTFTMFTQSAHALAAQAIWIDPKNTTGLGIGDTFVVDVMVNITDPDGGGPLTGLFGWEYKFTWDNNVVNAISIVTHGDGNPGADLLTGHTSVFVVKNTTGDLTNGTYQHWYGISVWTGTGFTGVASLCTYSFQVVSQPAFPNPDYNGILNIVAGSDKLVDDGANLLAHSTGDGVYTVPAVVPPEPDLKIEPSYVVGILGVQFNITIEIVNLFDMGDLCGWEAKLTYNTTMLDALNVYEGPFLPSFQGPHGTYFVGVINDTLGFIHMAGTFLGNYSTPSGSGALATVTFNTTNIGTSPLTLIDVALKGKDSTKTTTYPKWSDINNDGIVDIHDIVYAAVAFGSATEDNPETPGDESANWNPNVDFNNDSTVDITDMAIVSSDFGKLDGDPLWGVTNTIYTIPATMQHGSVTTTSTPDFSIAASPPSLTIQQGNSDTSEITVTSVNGFNQPIQLDVPETPSGVTATLVPDMVTTPPDGTATSTLTVAVDATTTPESYTLTVTGTNGTLTHSTDIPLKITVAENQPPICHIELQQEGVEIDVVERMEFFDIYVGDSTDDTGIAQVGFSSDDEQDGIPTGQWVWYSWGSPSVEEGWDSSAKIKSWAFHTCGYKEVWAQVKDDTGQTDSCSANIHVPGPYGPTDLAQCTTDGTEILVGATIEEDTVAFKATVSYTEGKQVKLQVELRRLDEYGGEFDETKGGLKNSSWVESGSEAIAYADGLWDAEYHWRARTVDKQEKTSEWIDFGNNDLSEPDFMVSVSKKILSVPYYYQGNTLWCVPNSMSMIFKYYGQNIHSWDIAEDWDWGRDEGGALPTTVSGCFDDHGLTSQDPYICSPLHIDYNDIFDNIKHWTEEGMPVLISIHSIEHAVVIVGNDITDEGSKKVYINDPSGKLIIDEMKLYSENLPLIAVEVAWNDLTDFIDGFSWLIAVEGAPDPPKGTIDIVDKGVSFWHGGVYYEPEVYSWLDKGLIWEHVGWHTLTLDPEDQFKFGGWMNGFVDNPTAYDQTYIFEVDFESELTRTNILWKVSVGNRYWNWNIMDTIPLRYMLPEYGEYTVTLRLWDELYTELYDEIVFPSIEYRPLSEFFLYSPADLYITDPQGFHVGVDPSTGEVVNEIPGAVYTGPESEPEVISIPDPLDGNYDVQLIGTDTGHYSVTTELITLEDTITETYIGEILEGEIHHYTASMLIETGEIEIVSWEHVFEDENRGTMLKISTNDNFFQFITPDKDYGIKNATYMLVHRSAIIILHKDNELELITFAVDTELDFCLAIAWDVETRTRYFLKDKFGIEN